MHVCRLFPNKWVMISSSITNCHLLYLSCSCLYGLTLSQELVKLLTKKTWILISLIATLFTHKQFFLFFVWSTEVIKGPNVGFFFYFGIIFFLKKIYVTKKFRNPYLSMEMATSVRTLTKTNKGWKYDMKEQSPSLRKMFQRHGAVNSNSLSGVTIADTRKSDTARFTM